MTKLKPFLAIAVIAGGCWFLRSQEKSDPDETNQSRTNAICGRCSEPFYAGWAPTTRCPSCGFTMSTARAKREHGPELDPIPQLVLPSQVPMPPRPDAPVVATSPREDRPWLIPALSLAGLAALLTVLRLLRRKKMSTVRYDAALAAALLLMEKFGEGGEPHRLLGQAIFIVLEAIYEAERLIAEPSTN